MRQNLDEKQQKQKDALLYLLNFFKKNSYQFTVITPLSHERILKRKKVQSSEPKTLQDIFGWNLPFSAKDLDQVLFPLLMQAELIQAENDSFVSKIRVASLEDELFIHSAYPTVENDAVFFGPDTYRFYYHFKQYLNHHAQPLQRCVELCCGSSAAAISIVKSYSTVSEMYAVDINPKALFYSEINQTFAGLENIYPIQSNLFSSLEGNFDLIFANPPYLMDSAERQYRHGGNELDGTDLAFDILKQGITHLSKNGSLFLYTGVAIRSSGNNFLVAVDAWIENYPSFKYTYEEIDPDVFGEELDEMAYQQIDRIAVALVKITAI